MPSTLPSLLPSDVEYASTEEEEESDEGISSNVEREHYINVKEKNSEAGCKVERNVLYGRDDFFYPFKPPPREQ